MCNFSSNFLILTFTIIILIVINEFNTQASFAIQSSYQIRDITDPAEDWTYTDYIKGDISKPLNNDTKAPESMDILGVNYVSNGTILNTTLWLSKNIENDLNFSDNGITLIGMDLFSNKTLINSLKNKNSSFINTMIEKMSISNTDPFGGKFDSIRYSLLIDVDSNGKTGWNGADYELFLFTKNGTWSKHLFELSSTGGFKELEKEYNVTGFFGDDRDSLKKIGYVTLSLDLGAINFPDTYSVLSYASIGSHSKSIDDFNTWIDLPPPNFNLLTIPTPIEVRLEDSEKNIGFQIISNGRHVGKILNLDKKYIPEGLTISPQPLINPTSIQIKASENKQLIGLHQIQMIANVSTESDVSGLSNLVGENNIITRKQDTDFRYQSQGIRSVPVNLTVVVLPEYTQLEKMNKFVSDAISPLKEIWYFLAAIGGIIVPLIISIYNKKYKHKTLNEYY